MERSDRLARVLEAAKARRLPPVDAWNPPFAGDIDLRIARDGRWIHEGAPIGRPALVRLFASVLRRDPDGRYYLVTPVEKVGILVEDAPFLAVEMAREGEGPAQQLHFRTNLDDWTTAGPDRPLRFERDAQGGLKPYVRVRGRLDALFTRSLVHDLVAIGEEAEFDGRPCLGVWSEGAFFPMAAADEIEARA
jgi:hypothetical protein